MIFSITTNLTSLGSSSNIILNINAVNLKLYNSSNVHTIDTNVSTSYTWTTPSVASTATAPVSSLITVDKTGTMGYTTPNRFPSFDN